MEQRDFAIDDLENIHCLPDKINEYLDVADNYFKNIYETLKREIKTSSFTEIEKNNLNKELEKVFSEYFDK